MTRQIIHTKRGSPGSYLLGWKDADTTLSEIGNRHRVVAGTDILVTLTKLILSQPVLCACAQMVVSKQAAHDPMVVPSTVTDWCYIIAWNEVLFLKRADCYIGNQCWEIPTGRTPLFILFLTTQPICMQVEDDDGKLPDKRVKKLEWELHWLAIFFPYPHMQ